MSEAFLKVVNMSISAGWLVLAVLVIRFILKKAPKWVNVLLWGLVAIRLICPFSIECRLSLVPDFQLDTQSVVSDSQGVGKGQILDAEGNVILEKDLFLEPQGFGQILDSNGNVLLVKPLNQSTDLASALTPVRILSIIWMLGMILMFGYGFISYILLKRKVATATPFQKGIMQSEYVSSPFVLGILRPVIYLPYGMDCTNRQHVVAHEKAHIRRKDHWWKPLGFLLLTVYWFNPLMWVAYILLCRDIELACDEKVIAQLDNEQRADYTQALVACSVGRRMIAACPLAFGEVGVKDRVKSIMNYRKPTFWIIVTALVVCAVAAVCFLTDPNPSREFPMTGSNVADLAPEAIVERILDIEDWESSNIYVNANNFGLTVDGEFSWMDSQAVRYFFGSSAETFTAQLRIFPDEGAYFLTEREPWPEQSQHFLLRHFLEALKYLPQHEIREMAPADRYLIRQIEEGTPSSYDRVITYSPEGVHEIDGWFIHLRLEPLHADGEGYHGTGDEVIDLFYGDTEAVTLTDVFEWADFDEDYISAEGISLETTLPDFPGVIFRYNWSEITAEDESGERMLFGGMPILNAYFTDLNADGFPEICATVCFGSGLVDTHVVVYDYANGQEYTLWDRGIFDYYLLAEDGKLLCERREFLNGPIYKGSVLTSGELILTDAGDGAGKKLTIDSADFKPYIVSIVDRTVTEGLPTDEAIEPFFEDEEYIYSFPSIRSHLVMVTYYDCSTEDIKTALEAWRVTISDLDRFGIHYYAEPKQTVMQPTETNIRGIAGGYLFTPINGATYRYAMTEVNPGNVTADLLLDTFTVIAPNEDIVWQVYSLKEYPDKTKLLLISDGQFARLCEYAPAAYTVTTDEN